MATNLISTYTNRLRVILQHRRFGSSGNKFPALSVNGNVNLTAQPANAAVNALLTEPNSKFYPLPGQTTTFKHYRESKVKPLNETTAINKIKLEDTDLLECKLPKEVQLDAVRTFGEVSSEERQLMGVHQLNPSSAHHQLSCTVVESPILMKKEFLDLFPDRAREMQKNPLTVITLAQHTQADMSAWSTRMEAERDELTGHFIDTATSICTTLKDGGHWADFIDPSSGRPYLGPFTNATLFETDERYMRLGMRIEDLGCCKVLTHPLWGTHAFIGTIFTDAPHSSQVVKDIAKQINGDDVI